MAASAMRCAAASIAVTVSQRGAQAVRCQAGAQAAPVMLLGPGSAAHREERCTASGTRFLAAHPLGYPVKIFRNNVPVASGLEIVFLQGAVFGRTRNEGGLQ